MKDGSVLTFPPGPDPVGQAVKYITGGPAHVAIFIGGLFFDDTVWHQPGKLLPVSGVRESLQADIAGWGEYTIQEPVAPWSDAEIQAALEVAITQVNLRRHYNIFLLLVDAILYPTRWFWDRIGWVPFGSWYLGGVCSSFAGLVVRATGRDPWPGIKTQELVPLDFELNREWRIV